MKTKVCSKCKEEKSIELFHNDRRKPDGKTTQCGSCRTKAYLQSRHKNLKKHREQESKTGAKRRLDRKIIAINYKGGKCEDCGIIGSMDNRSIFEFHHINPALKEREPGTCVKLSIPRLKQELDKCVLLCSNCHRLRHQHFKDGLRETL